MAGVQEYRRRLEMAGLTPAVAEVLALEQGDTDKLTEYSPRQLLDLVFQVFGDKDVLDNYQRARDEQRATELELEALSRQEEALQTRVETMKARANRYLEWRQLQTGIARLRDEALPVLAYLDAKTSLGNVWQNYRANYHVLNQAQSEHADTLQLVAKLKAAEVVRRCLAQGGGNLARRRAGSLCRRQGRARRRGRPAQSATGCRRWPARNTAPTPPSSPTSWPPCAARPSN